MRNYFIWNTKFRVASQVIKYGLGFLAEWSSAHNKAAPNPSSSQLPQWQCLVGWIKCNIDASLLNTWNYIGHNYILRDSSGTVIGSWSIMLQGGGNPFLEEATSRREVLSCLKNNQWTILYILEYDALNVITYLNNDLTYFSLVGLTFKDSRCLLSHWTSNRLVFVRRSMNLARVVARSRAELGVDMQRQMPTQSLKNFI